MLVQPKEHGLSNLSVLPYLYFQGGKNYLNLKKLFTGGKNIFKYPFI